MNRTRTTQTALSITVLALAGCADDTSDHEPSIWFNPGTFGVYEPQTPGEPVSGGERGPCPTFDSCRVECTVDVAGGQTDCPDDFAFDGTLSTAVLDLPSAQARMSLRLEVSDPQMFVFHLGDSDTDNGYGGDGGTFSNDAEIQLNYGDLKIFGNDYSVNDPKHIREFPGIVPANGPGTLWFSVADGAVSVRVDSDTNECINESSFDLLRLDAEDDEGAPDRRWYLGFNRAYTGGRSGSGLQQVTFCLD